MAKKSYEELRNEIEKHKQILKQLEQESKEKEKAEKELVAKRIGSACLKSFSTYNLSEFSSNELMDFFQKVIENHTRFEEIKRKREAQSQQQRSEEQSASIQYN